MLAIIILAVSTSPVVVDAQIRRRNGPRARLLEQVVWDPQESVPIEEEPIVVLIEDVSVQWVMNLSVDVRPLFLPISNDSSWRLMQFSDGVG